MKKRACLLLVVAMLLPRLSASAEDSFFSFAAPSEEVSDGAPAAADSGERVWTYPVARELLVDDAMDVIGLVNKDNLLEKDYPPKDELHTLVDATVKKTKNQEMLVRQTALSALEEMFAAAEADGAKLLLHSAYRSFGTQSTMYANRLERIGRDDGVVQKPGASDHQTGLGFDVINAAWAKEDRLTTKFAQTTEAQWMADNCHRYGFIIRYLEGKEDITGIMYEPWHLRYVGREVAAYMYANSLTLEEFTAEWRQAVAEYEMGLMTAPAGEAETEAVVSTFTF